MSTNVTAQPLSLITQTARSSRDTILNKLGIVDDGRTLSTLIKAHFVEVYQMSKKEANEEYLNVMRAEKANIASHIDLVTQAGWLAEEKWGMASKKDGNVRRLTVVLTEQVAPKVKPLSKSQVAALQKAGAMTEAQKAILVKNGLIVEPKPVEVPAVEVPQLENVQS